MNDENKQDRAERIAKEVANQVRGLLIDYTARIEKAGAEGDGKAKVAFAVDWAAYSSAPKIHTRISYSVSHKDETERVLEFDQIEMDFDQTERSVKTVQPEPLGLPDGETIDVQPDPEYLKEIIELPDGWETMCVLPDDETLVEVCTRHGEIHRGSFGPDEVDEDETVFRCDTDDTVCTIDLLGWRHIEDEAAEGLPEDTPTRHYNFYVDSGQSCGNFSTARTIDGKHKATSTAGDKFAADALLKKLCQGKSILIGTPKPTRDKIDLRGKTWHVWSVELQGWDYGVELGAADKEGDY